MTSLLCIFVCCDLRRRIIPFLRFRFPRHPLSFEQLIDLALQFVATTRWYVSHDVVGFFSDITRRTVQRFVTVRMSHLGYRIPQVTLSDVMDLVRSIRQ